MKLTFHGGARSVTGANYLLESGNTKILIDCGLLQGGNFCEKKNFEPFPYNPSEIKALFVTHAHIDHTGRIPQLVKDGFKGTIYSTPPTKGFAEELLRDSQSLLSRNAKPTDKESVYDEVHVERSLELWKEIEYHVPVEVGDFKVEFFDAGHILGSAMIKIEAEGKTILFSGDLGNTPAPIIKETEPFPPCDYCLIESTYGDREHEGEDRRREELEDAIEDTVKNGGVLMIPAFAMERTQDLLYHLHQLFEEGRVPPVPVFIDSPLAIKLTRVYKRYSKYFDEESAKHIAAHEDILNFPDLKFTLTTSESKMINDVPPPKIVIAGSGMSNGGRILHHERRYLPDPQSCILIVGYQAKGSLGRELLDGAPTVKIMRKTVPVKAHIREISAYSAHADQPRLLSFLRPLRKTVKQVFVVQGEDGCDVLAQKIKDDLAIDASVPEAGDEVVL